MSSLQSGRVCSVYGESRPCAAIIRKFIGQTPAQAQRSVETIRLFSGRRCPLYTEAFEKDFTDAVPVALFCSGHMGCEIKQIAGNVQRVPLSWKRVHFLPQ